ncbi:hypothetical protein EVAR_85901_1 [Eumeta japonica]|uniref:Uncharacterized protein n=1 Tax=Eumeta variegata TaxID=151549 RepID=A0A4C2A1R6_EUMVA|nr:hypothetical protein EVAR_85901_1 [Eumeta japonica]
MCKNILNIYKKGDIEQLKRKLEENEGTIYNNKSSQYILGDARQNMAAYNDTCGLVYLDEQATKITGKAKYKTPENDPIVVMTRHKGSLGRKNPENDEKTFKGKRPRLLGNIYRLGNTENYMDQRSTWMWENNGSFKNLTIKGIA